MVCDRRWPESPLQASHKHSAAEQASYVYFVKRISQVSLNLVFAKFYILVI